MKTKIVFLLITGIGLSCFWPQPTDYYAQTLLREVVTAIEENHLHPRPLDDGLSMEMYLMYLSVLDPDKLFFTQQDIEKLEPFSLQLDDELRNGTLEFYQTSTELLIRKTNQVASYYPAILSQDFDLHLREQLETDVAKLPYATDENALRDRWRKRIKWQLLEEVWIEENNNAAADVSVKKRAAIQRTRRYFDRQFARYQQVTEKERLHQYVNAFLKIHDVQTEYLSPVEKEKWDADFTRSLVGIGSQIEMVGEYPQLKELIVGGPAWKTQQLEAGDIVLKIAEENGTPIDVFGKSLQEILHLLRGESGTTVILTVRKTNAQTKEVPVIREKVLLDQAMAFTIENEIGYIKLPRFYSGDEGCASHILRQLKQLNDHAIQGLIIDLRDNKGGSAREAIEMLGYFLKEGVVMQSSYRDGAPRQYRDEDTTVQYTGKLLVMVNTRSSSGSELFAGTLQDYRRALIVGSTATYGKGTIQRFFNIEPEDSTIHEKFGNIKLTIGRFYTASGRTPQYEGITPDIVLPAEDDYIPTGERVHQYALKRLDLPRSEVAQSVCPLPDKVPLQAKSQERIQKNSRFQRLADYALQVKKNRAITEVNLDFKDYQLAKQTSLRQEAQLQEVFKTIPGFMVSSLPENDSIAMLKKERWRERIQGDPYVRECYLIMMDMLG